MREQLDALKSSVYDEDGWASDAQDAELYMDGDHLVFNGSGSLDLGHMVSLIAPRPEVSKQLAALERVRKLAESLRFKGKGQPDDMPDESDEIADHIAHRILRALDVTP